MSQLSNEPFHWQADGEDHAVLLLHGLGGGVYEMHLLAQELHAQGLTVRGFNYPGHDKPSHWMPTSRWEDWYARVEAVYAELAATHARVSVIGFSTGCLLGLHLAARHPVERLALISPFFTIRRAWYYLLAPEHYVRSLGGLIRGIPRFRPPIRDPHMQAQAKRTAYFKTFNLLAVRSALELIKLVRDELPEIRQPALILQSHHDSVVCPSGADFLMSRLGSPDKQIHWLHHSDHVVLLDVERDAAHGHILDFIRAEPLPLAERLSETPVACENEVP